MRPSSAPSHWTAAGIQSPVPLERLLGGIHVLRAQGQFNALEISSVTHDSRAVQAGALFCCLPGTRVDGHTFAARAAGAGAVALLCERTLDVPVPQIVVADARMAMAPVAAAFHGHPSRQLAVAGVTGTNGKTTVTHLLQSILGAAGVASAVIGTLTGVHTTPEATELQARLAELAAAGTRAVAMEVSSEALAQHRADATWFEVVAFTNLSPDHLNFHGTMENYFAAKASLFDPERARVAVVNGDDPWGRRLMAMTELAVRPFGLADAEALEIERDGSAFTWRGTRLRVRLLGAFNVANALAAATIAAELDVDPSAIVAGLGAVSSVPGRFQRVDGGGPVAVVVDYAHTPAGLEQALSAARGMAGAAGGRVIVVFGAGGDRDHAKRPAMGTVAAAHADVAVLTSDNPRSEDPLAIIDEVRAGATGLVVEPDRRAAIALAVHGARPGDVVVIAGKGHEKSQVFESGRTVPFDDVAVAREALEAVAGW